MQERDFLNECVQVGLYIQEDNQTVELTQATDKVALDSNEAIYLMLENKWRRRLNEWDFCNINNRKTNQYIRAGWCRLARVF